MGRESQRAPSTVISMRSKFKWDFNVVSPVYPHTLTMKPTLMSRTGWSWLQLIESRKAISQGPMEAELLLSI